MSILQSILLGILQGITEFLPVSSSGHLAVAQKLFNLEEVPLLYDVMLHLATLLAVCIFFRKTIWALICVLGRWLTKKTVEENTELDNGPEISPVLCGNDFFGRKAIIMIIVTTIVTAGIGIVTSKLIPELPIQFTFAGFLVTSIVLILTTIIDKKRESIENLSVEKQTNTNISSNEIRPLKLWQALAVGISQGIGTLPGISRSGSTIAGALFCKIDRRTAGDYSFIVSIPAILGAFVLEAKDLTEVSSSIGAIPVIFGCIAAFVSGYFALSVLMKLVRKGKLHWFAIYLIPLAVFGLIFIK